MSLATRCPVCQTVFRVVQDQLKVSEGWVRCGRCAKVFNAFEGLFDLEREFPALRSPTPSQRVLDDLARRNPHPQPATQWEQEVDSGPTVRDPGPSGSMALGPTSAPAAAPPTPAVTAARLAAQAAMHDTGPQVSAIVPGQGTAPPHLGRSTPAPPPVAPRDEGATVPPAKAPAKPAPVVPTAVTAFESAIADVQIRNEPTLAAPTADSGDQGESFDALFHSDGELAEPATAADDVDIKLDEVEPASLDPDDAVDSRLLTFVQQADKAERRRRPWVRAAMALVSLGLAAMLALQVAVVRRDAVVARWPETRSWLQSLCVPLECRIEPLRRIDLLSVDSSGLTRIDDGPVYRLALVLRNRGDTQLQTPSIDLSLTDASGALVTRRVLSAADLGASRATIAAGQELPLQALLMSAERPLTGYTIEIFYP